MKIKIKYTIAVVMEEYSENWEDAKTPEELLERVRDYIKDDFDYVLGAIDIGDKAVLTAEIVKDEIK